MGVHGLWQLIEPSGRPVPLETLESKVLAVDVSIWLHQAVKGFQDSKGAPIQHAHLLGIYHRVCKLLYFKVKPVFIFDGGIPSLKKQTIEKRNQLKSKNLSEAEKLQKQLLSTLLKHSAVSKILSEKTKASIGLPLKNTSKHENMYVLPLPELDSTISSSEEDNTEDTDSSPTKHWDLHTIDMTSTYFKSLPVDMRHEILTDLKETRKQSSWGRLHEMPKQSDDFSGYQVKRLLKRQAVQSALEETEKEMGGHSLSLAELESILKDHGVTTINDVGKRIASDENTRYLYIKDVKEALDKARKNQQKMEDVSENASSNEEIHNEVTIVESKDKADQEFEDDLQKAIALSLQQEPSTSKMIVSEGNNKRKLEFSFLENFNDADFQTDSSDGDDCSKENFSSAHNYMIEYSGLTPNEIAKILENKQISKTSPKKKLKQKHTQLNTLNISDSDDSIEFIKDSVEVTKLSVKKYVKPTQNKLSTVTSKKGDNIQITCNSEKTEVLPEQMNNKTEITKRIVPSEFVLDKYQEISSNKSELNTNESSGIDKITPDVMSQNQTKKPPDTNFDMAKTKQNNLKDGSTKTEEDIDRIEIMSDSDESTSSSIEFQDVSKNKDSADFMEIKINPSQMLDEEEDLFSDIFNENDKKSHINIRISPDSELGDGSIHGELKNKIDMEVDKHKTNEVETANEITTRETSIEGSHKIENKDETSNLKKLEKSTLLGDYKKASSTETREEVNEIQKLNLEEMQNLKQNLQKKKIDLMVEKSTRERMATNITDQMYQEAQELLELFGMPYVIAPMEAEAQCAFLDAIELTDGTITDDSDIWLFGGRTVYKNFFNQSKYVMEFKAENIKHHFKLTREQMILLALLVGSDYTTGIQGVGPVTALEILAAFPPAQAKEFTLSHTELLSGLKEFRSWINKGKTGGPGRSALKGKLRNICISENFPSLQVVEAYLDPTVDTSRETFSWGKPDFEGLTNFARTKFGWHEKKTEEILKPVIKRLEENRIQTSIKDFFKTTNKILTQDAKEKMSKRVKSAIDRMGKTPEELIEEEMKILSDVQQKKVRKKKQNKVDNKTSACSTKKEANMKVMEKSTGNKTRQKRTRKEPCEHPSLATNIKISESNKPKKEDNVIEKQVSERVGTSLEQNKDGTDDELQKYENIAKDLKQRRKRRNELSKIADITVIKKKQTNQLAKKPAHIKGLEEKNDSDNDLNQCYSQNVNRDIELQKCENLDLKEDKLEINSQLGNNDSTQNRCSEIKAPIEPIPEELEGDADIAILQATVSKSLKRVKEINEEVKNELNQETQRKESPTIRKKEVIHQKLRDRNQLLRNKMKAIEVFRKSKKGPGYVEKRKRKIVLPKNQAGLSESSSDE